MLFRSDALLKDKIYYPDIHNAQDWAFLFVATYFMSNISFVYGTFYYYRQCLNTTSTTRNKAYYNGVLDAYRFIIENLNKFDVEKKIYDKAFFSFSEIPISKLSEIGKSKEFENLEKEYLNSLEEIIGTYKYLNFDSLLLFYKRIFELNRLEKSISYRIGRIFTWLPRKIKTCFHNKKNLW